jgi:hypothetical protein
MYLLRDIQLSEEAIADLKRRCEDGELSEGMVLDTIEALEGEIGVKCDSIAELVTANDGAIAMISAEVKRLTAKLETLECFNDRLKGGLLAYLKRQDTRTVKTDFHAFSVCKNGGKIPIVYTADVPKEYCTFTPKPNGEAIRKALEDGQELEFAHFTERGEHLKIK